LVLGGSNQNAQAVTPTPIEGNATCEDFEGDEDWTELKIEAGWNGMNGTFSDGTLSVTISGITEAFKPPFNWQSDTISVDAVFVKGGNVGVYLYLYDPEAMSDTGLTTPLNPSGQPADISHISFCYDVEAATPTPTPTTPTPTPTTPTPTPPPSSTTTTPSSSSIVLGDSITDSVVVSGDAGTPTGTVDFYICAEGVVPCASDGTLVSTETLVNGAATSDPVTPTTTPPATPP